MKFLLIVQLFIFAYAQEPTAVPVALKKAEVLFKRKTKEFAKLVMEETRLGGGSVKSVFSSEKLDKGTFILKIQESCEVKNGIVVGEFYTSSGNTSSEFINEGLNLNEKKFAALFKKPKKGKIILLSCDAIKVMGE